ncbi:MAG: tetratricopeptide repeat protein [Gaiellaceae bacterium]
MDDPEDLYAEGYELREAGRHEEAVAAFDAALATATRVSPTAISALLLKASSLGDLSRLEDRLPVYEEVLARVGDDPDPTYQLQVAHTMYARGRVLAELDRPADALAAYDGLIERFGDAEDEQIQRRVAMALDARAYVFSEGGWREAAIEQYEEVASRFGDSTDGELRIQVAKALEMKAIRLRELGRLDESAAAYDELLVRFEAAPEGEIQERLARAEVEKLNVLLFFDPEQVLVLADALADRPDETDDPESMRRALVRLLAKSSALMALERGDEALEIYEEIGDRFADATDPAMREQVAVTLANRVAWLFQDGRFEEAEAAQQDLAARFGESALAAFDAIVGRYGAEADPGLKSQAAATMLNKATLLTQLGRHQEALATTEQLIDRFEDEENEAIERVVGMARDVREQLADAIEDDD